MVLIEIGDRGEDGSWVKRRVTQTHKALATLSVCVSISINIVEVSVL